MIMFKTSAHDQCANVRLGRQIWHSRTDREHLGTGLNQCANARLGVQIWHSRPDRDQYMSTGFSEDLFSKVCPEMDSYTFSVLSNGWISYKSGIFTEFSTIL